MQIKKSLTLALSATTLAVASQAWAVQTTTPHSEAAPVPHSDTASSPWQIGVRGLYVVPKTSSSAITSIDGHVTHIGTSVVPELDINYYFNPHLSTELILGMTRNSVKATGTALGDIDLGKVSLLPPTLTLLYHFAPHALISPYAGAGINYTYFFDANHGPTATAIHYGNSFGPALQAGVDFNINRHWAINFDVKKVFIESHVTVTAAGSVVTTDVSIDPAIYGLGARYRF